MLNELINQVLTSKHKQLEDAMHNLCDIVKLYEGEDYLQPIESIMPQLADYLLYDEQWNISGATISIFRRVKLNKDTIAKLLNLNQKKPNGLVVSALSQVDHNDWSQEIEQELVRSLFLELTATEAIRAIWENIYAIQKQETIIALTEVLNHKNQDVAQLAACTLCRLTKLQHKDLAIEGLRNFLMHSNNTPIHLEIADALGWATDQGFELLKITSNYKDKKVKLASINSIIRTYKAHPEASIVLQKLEKNVDKDISLAASNALK
jgi:hypothetical protein